MLNIYTDGGSRGNPGSAAIGYVFEIDNEAILEFGKPIGIATNNVAEYTAVLEAIKKAKDMGYFEIDLYLDSQLVERQLNGAYKVNSHDLLPIYKKILEEVKEFKFFRVTHIRREKNKRADKLVNLALDSNGEILSADDEINDREFMTEEKYEKIVDYLRVYKLENADIEIEGKDFFVKITEDELPKIYVIYSGLKDLLKKYYDIKNIILRIEDI